METTVEFSTDEEVARIQLQGHLDCIHLGLIWQQTLQFLKKNAPPKVIVDASQVLYCDVSGATLFAKIREQVKGEMAVEGLRVEYQPLVDMFDLETLAPLPSKSQVSVIEELGKATYNVCKDLKEIVIFTGELIVAMFWAIRNPRQVPWNDTWVNAESAGVNALPIICLIGFLLGLVMAFQSAVPMKRFGAEIFVADLIGLSMLKELGPLLTAIVLAGRSGSAFAAELGTMKVNEEINALVTMGIDPVRYLAITRVIASVLMTPILSIFCCLFALFGGAIVILSLGYPLVIYMDRIVQAVSISAFLAGVVKSIAFAVLVAGVGCLRGLQTGTGAKAVGQSTTSAVVSSIVLVAITDAIFSVVLFSLGI